MKDKIRKYVAYQLRNHDEAEKKDVIEEITTNTVDKYESLLMKYEDEGRAFREAISSIGDFSDIDGKAEMQYSIRPDVYDVGLIVATVLAVIGAIVIPLLGLTAAFLFTLASIVVFSASAYYTYHQAQYEKVVMKNIDRFNLYLDKTFSNTKTAFIFWAITFSFVVARMFVNLYVTIAVGAVMSDPMNLPSIDFGELIFVSIMVYIISLGLIASVFIIIYNKLIAHYKTISGNDHLDGKILGNLNTIMRSKMDNSENVLAKFFSTKAFIIFFLLVVIAHLFGNMTLIVHGVEYNTFLPLFYIALIRPSTYFIGLPMLLALLGWCYLLIRGLTKRDVSLDKFLLSFIAYLILFYLLMGFVLDVLNAVQLRVLGLITPPFTLLITFLLLVPLVLIRTLLGGKDIDESNR